MRNTLASASWRLATFGVVCLFFTFALYATFAQLRFQTQTTYRALFTNVSGLKENQFVRIGGVETGKVKSIKVQPNTTVLVEFTADPSVILTEGSRAVIRYDDLIGGRYLALEEGTGSTKRLNSAATIPLANTSPALDLDALIGGFRPLFHALDPEQTNELTGQIVNAFEGQGDTIGSFLDQTAALTTTLADRDDLIGQVITNLNAVLGSLGDQDTQFAKAVDSLAALVGTLAGRKDELADSVAHANASSKSIAELLDQSRAPIETVVHETDRTAGIVVADHDYVDNLLKSLPDAYQMLGRQGLYGDYFSFYLCDLVLKLNGKGGQPVYVKVAGQDSGRCTPR
ncbi:MCE family protein [Mycobacterium sp. AZCC_0083]|uniref:MCE family protein n=1 Tax=Mycobacterium sp. AZCC_0083 TaxID=2735882 RepID=UPI00161E7F33|nr:MCE family protein [Mycobacterium sp. AZCC_0083]MBB5164001.1 phospholipid/cholesterol/gamma-HCH transport system substrate-binding protein [Mycobacterium sp. AZCC_0083]